MSQVNGFKGFVGYSIRELNENEVYLYCLNNNLSEIVSIPLTQNQINFTDDFLIRTYTSGCYYYDTSTGIWSSNGMEVYEDTSLEQTHCMSYHLTSFAGGLNLRPSIINFHYALSDSSFNQNPTIYITIVVFVCLYILFAIWSWNKDRSDLKKINIVPLKDIQSGQNYFYELMVFTGNRNESETNSKVKFFQLVLATSISP